MMFVRILTINTSRRVNVAAKSSTRAYFSTESDTIVFPRQTEGNIYPVNWSLNADGIVPKGNAYRNARLAVLTSNLKEKPSNGILQFPSKSYSGDFTVQEAGDDIPQDTFEVILQDQKKYLSSGRDIFIEDLALGAHFQNRIGVRIVTDNPAIALAARSLLISIPPRNVNHLARFTGWNLENPQNSLLSTWDGKQYHLEALKTPQEGERPIVAFVGGPSTVAAVQFVQQDGKILGANISIGNSLPLNALIQALELASTVLFNANNPQGLALPSLSLTEGRNTRLVVGAVDDSFIQATGSSIYGAYSNFLSPSGVSALWGGVVLPSPAQFTGSLPLVSFKGLSAIPLHPNNMAYPANHIFFYEKGAFKQTLSEEEAAKKISALTGPEKESVAMSIVKGTKLSLIGSPSDLN